MAGRVIVLDNGGAYIRAGFAGQPEPAIVVPNATARIKRQLRLLVADETDTKIKDHSQLQYFRPVERGCVTDTAVQNVVWDRVFGQALLNVKTEDCTLLLTVPPFMPSSAQEALDDLVFDTYGFAAYARLTPQQMAIHAFHSNSVGKVAGAASSAANTASISAEASSGSSSTRRLAAVGDGPESWWATIAPSVSREQGGLAFSMSGTGVIIDSGFSFTHVVPFVNWAPVAGGIRRVDVGGKALTNMLKECLSYRQFNLMDDAWLVTRVKEALCYASVDFMAEMALARKLSQPGAINRATAKGRALAAAKQQASLALPDGATSAAPSGGGAAKSAGAAAGGPSFVGSKRSRESLVGSAASSSTAVVPTADDMSGYFTAASKTRSHASVRPIPGCGPSTTTKAFASSSSSPASPAPLRQYDGSGIGIRREFVLPDYLGVMKGYVRGGPEDRVAVALRDGGIDTGAAAAGATDISETAGTIAAKASSQLAAFVGSSSSGGGGGVSESKGDDDDEEGMEGASGGPKAKQSKFKSSAGAGGKAAEGDGTDGDHGEGRKLSKKQRRKEEEQAKAAAASAAAAIEEQGSDDEGDDDDVESTDDDEDESSDDDDDEVTGKGGKGKKKDSEYRGGGAGKHKSKGSSGGGKGASAAAPPPPPRRTSARASKAGVSQLTAAMRNEGLIENEEEDEEQDTGHGASSSSSIAMSSDAPPPVRSGFARADGSSGGGGAAGGPEGQPSDAQVLVMNAERIAIPEALFRPSEAGISQAGLPDAVAAAIAACPAHVQPALWSSIIITGGNARMPGLEARLYQELRRLAPQHVALALYTPASPELTAWKGGSVLGCRPDLSSFVVTRQQWWDGKERDGGSVMRRFTLQGGPALTQLQAE